MGERVALIGESYIEVMGLEMDLRFPAPRDGDLILSYPSPPTIDFEKVSLNPAASPSALVLPSLSRIPRSTTLHSNYKSPLQKGYNEAPHSQFPYLRR